MTGNQTITCLSARSITADAALEDFLVANPSRHARVSRTNICAACTPYGRVRFLWMRMGEILLSLLERCNNKIEISLFYFLSLSLFLFVGLQVSSTFNVRIAKHSNASQHNSWTTADAALGCKHPQTRRGVQNNWLHCIHTVREGLFPLAAMGKILLSLLARCNCHFYVSLFLSLSLSLSLSLLSVSLSLAWLKRPLQRGFQEGACILAKPT